MTTWRKEIHMKTHTHTQTQCLFIAILTHYYWLFKTIRRSGVDKEKYWCQWLDTFRCGFCFVGRRQRSISASRQCSFRWYFYFWRLSNIPGSESIWALTVETNCKLSHKGQPHLEEGKCQHRTKVKKDGYICFSFQTGKWQWWERQKREKRHKERLHQKETIWLLKQFNNTMQQSSRLKSFVWRFRSRDFKSKETTLYPATCYHRRPRETQMKSALWTAVLYRSAWYCYWS